MNSVQSSPSVALVHDYFAEYGGAERVVEALHNIFPEAPVYTAFVDKKKLGVHWKRFKQWQIHQSWARFIPFFQYKLYSPLRIFSHVFFRAFNLSQYDMIISSTNMYMAKAAIASPTATHICYCHTPPRSLYGYSTMTNWKKHWFIRIGGEILNHFMRIIDFQTAQNPDIFIANSKEVQKRIEKFYRRKSIVIYPPITIPTTLFTGKKQQYYLYVGRLAASKHVDLAVRACVTLQKKLVIVGGGGNIEYIQKLAKSIDPSSKFIEFAGAVSDKKLDELYSKATCVLYPAEDEDFGMIAVEAMAHGTPVLVHKSGGFLESVVEGKTGVFFTAFTLADFLSAIKKSEKIKWDPVVLYNHAKKFSSEVFKKNMLSLVSTVVDSK